MDDPESLCARLPLTTCMCDHGFNSCGEETPWTWCASRERPVARRCTKCMTNGCAPCAYCFEKKSLHIPEYRWSCDNFIAR